MMLCRALSIFLFVALLPKAQAVDDFVGVPGKSIFDIENVFLKAQGRVSEEVGTTVDPLQWQLGVKGRFSSYLDFHVSMGATSLLYLPYWVAPVTKQVSMIDGFGE